MENKVNGSENTVKPICGIIMPISGGDGYSKEHWSDVKTILEEVIMDAGFKPNLVSDANDVGIIHNRIVQNIYNNPLVVCDVSSKNPNVMFELGLRLAFDKATIIVKDDVTSYTFDTGVIEHLGYPRDLRYGLINSFKANLKLKLLSTYTSSTDPNYSTFLKHFVQYKTKLDEREVTSMAYLVHAIDELNNRMSEMKRATFMFNESSIDESGLTKDRIERVWESFVDSRDFIKFDRDEMYLRFNDCLMKEYRTIISKQEFETIKRNWLDGKMFNKPSKLN
jgi:hypothetical protein